MVCFSPVGLDVYMRQSVIMIINACFGIEVHVIKWDKLI